METEQCPADWTMVKLGDLGEVNRGRSRHRPRYAEHLYGGPYPFIQTGDIKAAKGRITQYEQTYNEEGLAQSRLWPTGTMCITIAANIAETGILAFPACFPDSVVGFMADEKKCDVYFIEYIFRYLRSRIQHEASGSVQDNINLAVLDRLRFPIPPLAEQRAIASILGALDDKIELNRRMNETLEAMARALFQSWFVDFDPVRAKAEGRQPAGMDAETAALFPDAFEESALGAIPRGWRVGRFGEIAINLRTGAMPGTLSPDTPYIGLEHMPSKSIALADWATTANVSSNKFVFRRGEILFGKLRPYFHKVGIAPIDGVCSTDILVIAPQSPEWFGLALLQASSSALIDYATARSDGTRMPRTNWHDLARYQVVIPSQVVAQATTSQIQPIVHAIQYGIMASRTLATIRDALMPKLMSGEIRVQEAERLVESTV